MKTQKQTMIIDRGFGSRKESGIRLKTSLKAGVRKAGEKPLEY